MKPKTNPRTIHCDTCDEDQAFLEKYNEQVDMLYGMVQEMVRESTHLLLSPVMRRMLAEKADEVQSMHRPLRMRLRIDNPCDPITKWSPE